MPTAVKSWKFLVEKNGKIISDYGQHRTASMHTVWEVGEWKHQDGIIRACYNGFHHSNNPYDALSYVGGSVLARVEVKGTRAGDSDDEYELNHKEAVSDMRIVKAGMWGKNDSVGLAFHVAHFAASWLADKSRLTRVRATTDETKLINAGLSAARDYLRGGTPVPLGVVSDLSSASWCARYSEVSNVIDAVYQVVAAAGTGADTQHASSLASYGVSNVASAMDRGNYKNSLVKAVANDWMENRFKTLPRL